MRSLTVPDELEPRRTHPAEQRPTAVPADEPGHSGATRDLAVAAALRRLAEADRRRAAEFLSASYRDELTGALLRRPGRHRLELAIAGARQTSTQLCIVFFDVDNLKLVNDRDGHAAGDRLLAATGQALRLALRSDDLVVRYGGDEFVCAMPTAGPEDVTSAIDRVRRTLDHLVPGASVSVGCAHLEPTEDLDEVICRADADLYAHRRRRRRAGDGPGSGPMLATGPGGQPTRGAEPAVASVACGACASRIHLDDFVLVSEQRMTRVAGCPACGETTLILLAEPCRSDASHCGNK